MSLCHDSAWLTRRAQGDAGGASLRQPVTLQVNQLLDPAREVPAEAVHVELSVDLRAALAQTIEPQERGQGVRGGLGSREGPKEQAFQIGSE